ncbi:VCBS repeat-containing protein [Streptomyces sp. NPDC094049]|uniref:FG-GAP repeat domain-containing protein n=1 Tax=Streptomyces sp. NPDC094049 TaxID=3154987 RepID=UPI003331B31A
MTRTTRTAGTRLRTAVTAVLAVTAVSVGTVAPSFAAVPTAASAASAAPAASERIPLTLPPNAHFAGAGRTGVLSYNSTSRPVYRWTRFSDGVTTPLPAGKRWADQGTDTVASQEGAVFTLTDMSGAKDPVVIDTSAVNTAERPLTLTRVIGGRLLMSETLPGGRQYHLVSLEQGRVVDRPVPLQLGAPHTLNFSSGPEDLTVHYSTTVDDVVTRWIGEVDLASGEITRSYPVSAGSNATYTALSRTHVAWIESTEGQPLTLAFGVRGGSGTDSRTALEGRYNATNTFVRLLGDWVAYGRTGGGIALSPDALYPLTVRSVHGGPSFKVLDHVVSHTVEPDGSLLALGGSLEHGEGLYRVAPGADGRPAATLLTTPARPTALTVEEETLPPSGVVDLDSTGGGLRADLTLSRDRVRGTMTVTHLASGTGGEFAFGRNQNPRHVSFTWNGMLSNGIPAYNGAYSWAMTVEPINGIGPDVTRTGTFTLARAAKPRDFNDNGVPDLLSLGRNGKLGSYDLYQAGADRGNLLGNRSAVEGDWSSYDRVAVTGDLGGTAAGDVVSRDSAGVLWLHQGNGAGFAPRTRIGGGWQIYDKLTAGSDLTGDGRPDLVAADTTGKLWLYPATGNTAAPFATRKLVGGGWGIFNQITATGDLGGAAHGDLVARDTAGVLWLYLGKGDGTFAPRSRIGGGWERFTGLLSPGDVNGDGRNDLVAHTSSLWEPATHDVYVYPGTGAWRTPFGSRTGRVEGPHPDGALS